MFLRNSWYVAGWSKDLTDRPLARTLLGEAVVIFRGASGDVTALEDRCPHRHLPLSMGAVVGDTIQCGYHGMVYNREGACVAAPSQGAAPPRARVKAYPTIERFDWIWVWMGEAEKADPALVPDFSLLTAPGYRAVGSTNHVKASYKLVTDNLMDLSHVGFVHQTTIGNPQFTEKGQLTLRKTERGVQVLRLVSDVPPPPTYVLSGTLPEGKTIDRWAVIDFMPPSSVVIHVGGAEAGTGALEGRYEHGLNLWVMNSATPETETTCNYYWASVRKHDLDNPATDELFFTQVSEAFEEDRRVLEAQQRSLLARPDSWDHALKSDAGAIRARRLLDALIAGEQAARPDEPAISAQP
jgi:phenylpropionate dioxygenase-like ring-hydroxylating dioxygenase large terminal subunit